MNTAQMAPHLLLLCFLKLGGSVIVMKDRNYEAVNTTHTKLSFKMTSRGRFGLASSQDQAMMRSGLCKVQHHTCPKSLCGEVEFTSTLRNKKSRSRQNSRPVLSTKGFVSRLKLVLIPSRLNLGWKAAGRGNWGTKSR